MVALIGTFCRFQAGTDQVRMFRKAPLGVSELTIYP